MKYQEVGRFGGYGIAKRYKKDIESKSNRRVFIFKDISNDPFVSFKKDLYVVAVEIEEPKND